MEIGKIPRERFGCRRCRRKWNIKNETNCTDIILGSNHQLLVDALLNF